VKSGELESDKYEARSMNFKWIGPLALLAALVIGDQVRIHRPGHKYRLAIELETPSGTKSASGVMAVFPDRGYSRAGHTVMRGDALFLDLGAGKNLLVLLAHADKSLDLDGMNYLALRAYGAAGKRVSFNDMARMTGVMPITGALIPVFANFTDLADPATMRAVRSDELQAVLGAGFKLRDVSVEVVPNGFWPLDFGGALGAQVTRGIEAKLPWWNTKGDSAAVALAAAGLNSAAMDAKEIFTRK
jgi:hypothetical protein